MERKNINRGYKKLQLWNDSMALYVLAYKILSKLSYDLKRSTANSIDAILSVSRNIAEGYCRKSIKEYLNHLNYSLGSCGEFHSDCCAFFASGHISTDQFEELDQLHFKIENYLINLISSLQGKQKTGTWEDTFSSGS